MDTCKTYFVFVPPYQVSASKVTKRAFVSWGLEFIEASSIYLHGCTVPSHRNHVYLYPFFATNDQLLMKYEALKTRDDDDDVSSDYAAQNIRDNKVCCTGTKFHCSGPAFKPNTRQYKETDWPIRLFHSIREKLPGNITAEDSCRYRGGGGEFRELQELYSTVEDSNYYCFTAIPDLIFTKKITSRGPDPSTVTSACVVTTEQTDIIEIKNGGYLSSSRTNDVPHAVAQVFAWLHVSATAAVLKALVRNDLPGEINCKGL